MRIGCPDFAAIEQPTIFSALSTTADTGQIRTRTGFAHANTEKGFATTDSGNVKLALCLGAVTQQ